MKGLMAITMAGLGSRFQSAGYTCPKYEIQVLGRPLFDWSMLSLDGFRKAGWRFSFVARNGLQAEEFIYRRADKLEIPVESVLKINNVTDGQATTALLLAEKASENEPFAVYNIDTFVNPEQIMPPSSTEDSGWVPCFEAPGDGWSFARADVDGRILEIREKKRISENATLGLYWFNSAKIFVSAYSEYYSTPGREEKGERYIAPLYNQLIRQGGSVRMHRVSLEQVGMLGTPEQVSEFASSPPDCATKYVNQV